MSRQAAGQGGSSEGHTARVGPASLPLGASPCPAGELSRAGVCWPLPPPHGLASASHHLAHLRLHRRVGHRLLHLLHLGRHLLGLRCDGSAGAQGLCKGQRSTGYCTWGHQAAWQGSCETCAAMPLTPLGRSHLGVGLRLLQRGLEGCSPLLIRLGAHHVASRPLAAPAACRRWPGHHWARPHRRCDSLHGCSNIWSQEGGQCATGEGGAGVGTWGCLKDVRELWGVLIRLTVGDSRACKPARLCEDSDFRTAYPQHGWRRKIIIDSGHCKPVFASIRSILVLKRLQHPLFSLLSCFPAPSWPLPGCRALSRPPTPITYIPACRH